MNILIQKYQDLCLKYRRVINEADISSLFNQEEIKEMHLSYGSVDLFIKHSLDINEFYTNNQVMFVLCKGCPFYNQCLNDKHAKCKKNNIQFNFDNVEFVGEVNLLKWFYFNTILYLNEYQDVKSYGGFFDVFKRINKIKLKNKSVVLYSDHFHHYERVKSATFLAYQGTSIELLLEKIMFFISGNHCEFYFDNITNEADIKSPIEEIMFKALDNHPFLRKKYKYTLEKQAIITDNTGNLLFTLDMLMTINNDFNLCIECDGYNYHSDPERFELDRRRDRTLLKRGIYTARFSSHDINYRLDDAIDDIKEIIEFHINKKLFR